MSTSEARRHLLSITTVLTRSSQVQASSLEPSVLVEASASTQRNSSSLPRSIGGVRCHAISSRPSLVQASSLKPLLVITTPSHRKNLRNLRNHSNLRFRDVNFRVNFIPPAFPNFYTLIQYLCVCYILCSFFVYQTC